MLKYSHIFETPHNFLSLLGTFDSLSLSLTFPKTTTHQPQIATTPLPTPTTLPKAPIDPVLYDTAAMIVVSPTRIYKSGTRVVFVAGGA